MERSRQQRRLHHGVAQLRHQFTQCAGSIFGNAMPEAEIRQIVEEEAGAYRDRIYPPIETLRLFIGQVLSEDRACQEVAGRRLSERIAKGESACSLNTGPYCKARQRLPLQIPVRLLRGLGRRLEAKMQTAWRWRGRCVKLLTAQPYRCPIPWTIKISSRKVPNKSPDLVFRWPALARSSVWLAAQCLAMLWRLVLAKEAASKR